MKIERRIEPLTWASPSVPASGIKIGRWRAVGICVTLSSTVENAARWTSFAHKHRAAEEIERASFRQRRPTGARDFGQVDLGDEGERDGLQRFVRPDFRRRPLEFWGQPGKSAEETSRRCVSGTGRSLRLTSTAGSAVSSISSRSDNAIRHHHSRMHLANRTILRKLATSASCPPRQLRFAVIAIRAIAERQSTPFTRPERAARAAAAPGAAACGATDRAGRR